MLKFKFGAWAVVLMLTAFSFSACDDNDDETYNPPVTNWMSGSTRMPTG